MPGSLWAEHLLPALLPGDPKVGRLLQPSGWSQRVCFISTMPGSLWREHLVAPPPGSPKIGCVSQPSGWSQRLLTTSSMPGFLCSAQKDAELDPNKPNLRDVAHPGLSHKWTNGRIPAAAMPSLRRVLHDEVAPVGQCRVGQWSQGCEWKFPASPVGVAAAAGCHRAAGRARRWSA